MASFELSRAGSVADIARASHAGRFLPLYLAGIAAGAGLGLALTFASNASDAAITRTAPAASQPAPASAPGVEPAAEIAFVPAPATIDLSPGAALNALPELPQAPLAALFAPAPATAPVPAAAPAAPVAASPVVPVASAPVAPAAAPAAEAPPAAPATVPAKPNFYVPEPAAGGVTALEQRLFDGINAERAAAGLAPYAFDQNLSRIARIRVQQLVDQNYFGHTDPFGYSMYVELLAHFGYTSYAWAGENLAMNNYGAAESPERAVAALMRSPTHKANILAGDFFRIGIGEYTTPDGRHFYAMIFLG